MPATEAETPADPVQVARKLLETAQERALQAGEFKKKLRTQLSKSETTAIMKRVREREIRDVGHLSLGRGKRSYYYLDVPEATPRWPEALREAMKEEIARGRTRRRSPELTDHFRDLRVFLEAWKKQLQDPPVAFVGASDALPLHWPIEDHPLFHAFRTHEPDPYLLWVAMKDLSENLNQERERLRAACGELAGDYLGSVASLRVCGARQAIAYIVEAVERQEEAPPLKADGDAAYVGAYRLCILRPEVDRGRVEQAYESLVRDLKATSDGRSVEVLRRARSMREGALDLARRKKELLRKLEELKFKRIYPGECRFCPP